MGWQGLDIKIFLLSNKEDESSKLIFYFEGDPDDTSWSSVKFDLNDFDLSKYTTVSINMENKSNIGKKYIEMTDNTIIDLDDLDYFYKSISLNEIKNFIIDIKNIKPVISITKKVIFNLCLIFIWIIFT